MPRAALSAILQRHTAMHVALAADGEVLEDRRIRIAPPDRHVLVGAGATLELNRGPRVNGFRPAIDPTMRSAAEALGPLVTGVVLSGTRDDGTAGLAAIKAAGGRAVVQDPDDALYDSMPRAALAAVGSVDAVLPVRDIAARLAELIGPTPASSSAATPATAVRRRR
jgi:two-component system chemotaxis response regulator CheB